MAATASRAKRTPKALAREVDRLERAIYRQKSLLERKGLSGNNMHHFGRRRGPPRGVTRRLRVRNTRSSSFLPIRLPGARPKWHSLFPDRP